MATDDLEEDPNAAAASDFLLNAQGTSASSVNGKGAEDDVFRKRQRIRQQ